MSNKSWKTSEIVLMALFSALTVVGTSIRVPLPAMVGNPFIHFGMPILCLAVLTLGFFKGSLAGGIGFAMFDFLNGFAAEAPYFILESFVVGGTLAFSYYQLKRYKDKVWFMPVIMIFTAIAKLFMSFMKNLVIQLMMGNSLSTASFASFTTLYITFINTIAAIVLVSILYKPISKMADRVLKK